MVNGHHFGNTGKNLKIEMSSYAGRSYIPYVYYFMILLLLRSNYLSSLGIFSVVPSDKTMCPEVNSASENEYQGFSCGKGGRFVWLTTYHPCSAERRDYPGP
jgi:hypothetical protein